MPNDDDIDPSGPYIQAALFCEKVLTEASGVNSLIRVIDRTVLSVAGPNAPTEMPTLQTQLTLVLMLKAGATTGRHRITVTPIPPSERPLPPTEIDPLFEGSGDRGVNLFLNLKLKVEEEGCYWFDVECDNRLLTRIPFRFVYQRSSQLPDQRQP